MQLTGVGVSSFIFRMSFRLNEGRIDTFRYFLSRRVLVRLSGIAVDVRSVISSESFRLNHGRIYNFRYSRSRRVCVRLTGISVDLSSFIFRM